MLLLKEVKSNAGFTLVELMIALVIAAILAAIAIPSYTSFVERGKMRTAQADLVALSTVIENVYQRTLAYPDQSTATDPETDFNAWNAASDAGDFTFTYISSAADDPHYTLTANGQGNLTGCTITLQEGNVREISGCPQGQSDWI